MENNNLFSQILSLCGLSPLLAPGTVRRALKDIGAEPDKATSLDYLRCLPKLSARMKVYLSDAETHQRTQQIRSFLENIQGN